jgi:hypothetical protein
LGGRLYVPSLPRSVCLEIAGIAHLMRQIITQHRWFRSLMSATDALFKRPWAMALVLFIIFFSINGYYYGWDDQHLEIPLLKHLIDPQLYAGDYYVESLKENFSSFFYPILARLITVEQIPTVYFILYLLSRYGLIYFLYKIWLHFSRDRFVSVCAVLVFILISRVHEFLYRTFSHQEFALAFIFWAMYLFFKRRYYLAALIFGLSANIHALYSLFPMTYMSLYLLWQIRKEGWKTFIGTGLLFTVTASPFVIWTVMRRFMPEAGADPLTAFPDWIKLYITSCPQNFFYPQLPQIPFKALFTNWNVFLEMHNPYVYLVALFVLNMVHHKDFRENKHVLAFCAGAAFYLVLCFLFTYVWPSRFMLDLNLCRNTQYLLFLLTGFTTWLVIKEARTMPILNGWILVLAFSMIKYHHKIAISGVVLIFLMITFVRIKPNRIMRHVFRGALVVMMLMVTAFLTKSFYEAGYTYHVCKFVTILFGLMSLYILAHYLEWIDTRSVAVRSVMFFIPMFIYLVQFGAYHYQKIEQYHSDIGFWRMQRSWEDMQRFVKAHTPKDAMILVPYNMEMGGFRIQSERKIICSYRDCGIIGFDYGATVEWMKRVADIREFTYDVREPLNRAIQNAIQKYGANYIVFMRYTAPKDIPGVIERTYINQDFVLYRVGRNTNYVQ